MTPADNPRRIVWYDENGALILLDTLAAKATAVDLAPATNGSISLALSGDERHGWPAETLLSITHGEQETWSIPIARNEAGKLRHIRLPAGNYRLTATAPHLQRIERFNVAVRNARDLALGTLQFIAAARLTAHVVDSAGKPLGGVTLLNADDAHVLGAGDANGDLDVELPHDRPEAIELLAPGYASHRLKVEPGTSDAALGTVTLRTGVVVRVTIDRARLAHTQISAALLHAEDGGNRYQVIAKKPLASADSSLQFTAVEPGDYSLLIEGESPLQRYSEHLAVSDRDLAVAIRIEPVRLTGEVLLEDRPLSAAVLSLQPSASDWEQEIELNERGEFSGELWQKGSFYAHVSGGQIRSGNFIHQPLEASTDPTHWHIVVPNRRITGRVFDEKTGKPIAAAGMGAEVSVEGGNSGLSVIQIADDGSYSIDMAEPGKYRLDVTAPGYLAAFSEFTLREDDRLRTVDFAMHAGRPVQLLVLGSNGNPIADATVIDGLGDGINPNDLLSTDAAGRIDLQMRQGDVKTLYILPAEGSFLIVDIRSDSISDAPMRLIVPPPAGDLRIHARNTAGQPVRNVFPLLRYGGRFLPPPVPRFLAFADHYKTVAGTDDAGDTVFRALPAGVYEIFPCRNEQEIAATLAGNPPREPVRTAFDGTKTITLTVSD